MHILIQILLALKFADIIDMSFGKMVLIILACDVVDLIGERLSLMLVSNKLKSAPKQGKDDVIIALLTGIYARLK